MLVAVVLVVILHTLLQVVSQAVPAAEAHQAVLVVQEHMVKVVVLVAQMVMVQAV